MNPSNFYSRGQRILQMSRSKLAEDNNNSREYHKTSMFTECFEKNSVGPTCMATTSIKEQDPSDTAKDLVPNIEENATVTEKEKIANLPKENNTKITPQKEDQSSNQTAIVNEKETFLHVNACVVPNDTELNEAIMYLQQSDVNSQKYASDEETAAQILANMQHFNSSFTSEKEEIINEDVFLTENMETCQSENINVISAEYELAPLQSNLVLPVEPEIGSVVEISTAQCQSNENQNNKSDENEGIEHTEDHDYIPTEEDESSTEEEQDTMNKTDEQERMSCRGKKAAPETWGKNVQKIRRRDGLNYTTSSKKEKPARSIGKPCTSNFCLESEKRQCNILNQQIRTAIFENYWIKLRTWEERRVFVKSSMKQVPIIQTKAGMNSRRHCTWEYYLSHNNISYRVCKKMFCSTLGMPQRTIMNWCYAGSSTNEENEDKPNKSFEVITEEARQNISKQPRKAHNATPPEDLGFITTFLESLATIPSHYCRATYKDTKFLEPGTRLVDLYEEYKSKAVEAGKKAVSYPLFKKAFDEGNYSVFIPRKDQCNICISAKHGIITQEELAGHRRMKTRAQECKSKDKDDAIKNSNISTWTVDMQAVLLSPKTDASCMYYKTKLQLHNFTLFCLENKEAFCYTWTECDGDLSSDRFAWLLYKHFKTYLEKNPNIKTLIVWSDGCGYQNRNATLSNAYLHLAKCFNITIFQKYLVAGHTQMECDSIHSTIERKIRGQAMYSPREYVIVMQISRKTPSPYNVTELLYDFWEDGFSDLYVTSIRPGKKAGDPTVHDLRVLQYTQEGIQFCTDFDNPLQPLPQRIKGAGPLKLKQSFTAKIPLTKRKYDDLQSLKEVIPKDCHQFYNSLPYVEKD